MNVNLAIDPSPRTDDTEPDTVSARIPLNTLAIPFGLLGYAGTWDATRTAFGWDPWVAEPFWVLATASLVWLVIAHTVRGRDTASALVDQLRDPTQGPMGALLPISVVLLGGHVYPRIPVAGATLVYGGASVACAYAAWLFALWIRTQVPVEAIHGGYFLPTVAGGYISAGAAAAIGNKSVAIAAFSVGTFFWVVIFTILIARLLLVAPLPKPLTPTLVILVAPPAVGGMAWFAINARTLDRVSVALLGSTVFMLLVQLALIPTYRKLRFSLGFWAFTFSLAAVASQIIVLSGLTRYTGWQIVVTAALVAVSAFITTIATKSRTAADLLRRGARAMERQHAKTDDLAARRKPRRRG